MRRALRTSKGLRLRRRQEACLPVSCSEKVSLWKRQLNWGAEGEKELVQKGRGVFRGHGIACAKALSLGRTWGAQDRKEKLGPAYLRIEPGSLNYIYSALWKTHNNVCLYVFCPPCLPHFTDLVKAFLGPALLSLLKRSRPFPVRSTDHVGRSMGGRCQGQT